MNRIADLKQRVALAITAMALVAGCSTLPTVPDTGGAPERIAAGTSGANPTPILAAPISASKQIIGVLGGQVAAGDFAVVLPPSAVSGLVTVTVTQPDRLDPMVSLHITPASANKFKVPVTLVVDASRLSVERLAKAYVAWQDPVTGSWVPMSDATVDLERRTIRVPLQHFSNYALMVDGKAGW